MIVHKLASTSCNGEIRGVYWNHPQLSTATTNILDSQVDLKKQITSAIINEYAKLWSAPLSNLSRVAWLNTVAVENWGRQESDVLDTGVLVKVSVHVPRVRKTHVARMPVRAVRPLAVGCGV